jgi:hypothetical protein
MSVGLAYKSAAKSNEKLVDQNYASVHTTYKEYTQAWLILSWVING